MVFMVKVCPKTKKIPEKKTKGSYNVFLADPMPEYIFF